MKDIKQNEITEKIGYIKNSMNLIEDFSRDILLSLETNISKIKYLTDEDEINNKFDEIQKTLSSLEGIIWNDSFNFNKKLYLIVKDFDRVDDLLTRKYLTEMIKDGKYD